ncbi:MAG: 1-acyl-sn-glycerol-3-phosphate acyltransferase [Planctomycetota bacterium]|jgi:1-acyl-sn-glycerol-3-phosphate acyltransferase|nr:1-acyl-sn-glycerol-3-phosphate acyltransferase [Planctomycetota bacterium]
MGERFYGFSRWCVRRLFACLGGLEVKGRENVPETGPLIVAANHASCLDPMLLGAALDRSLHFLARRTLFDIPGFGWLIRQNQAFPLEREGDSRDALRIFGRLLEQGRAVVMFPEGTRSRDGAMGEMRPGLGMLAARSLAPVLPAYIWGSFQSLPRDRFLPRRHRFKVLLGPPVPPGREGSRLDRRRVNETFGQSIRGLEREAWRGEKDVPPILAKSREVAAREGNP